MTTIVYRAGILAGDTRTCVGGTTLPERARKVWRLRDGTLFGWAGNYGLGIRLLDHFRNPKFELPLIRDKGTAIVIRPNGKIFTYEDDTLLPVNGCDYVARGSGMDYALGALVRDATAVEAVQAARILDPAHTGGRILTVKLRG